MDEIRPLHSKNNYTSSRHLECWFKHHAAIRVSNNLIQMNNDQSVLSYQDDINNSQNKDHVIPANLFAQSNLDNQISHIVYDTVKDVHTLINHVVISRNRKIHLPEVTEFNRNQISGTIIINDHIVNEVNFDFYLQLVYQDLNFFVTHKINIDVNLYIQSNMNHCRNHNHLDYVTRRLDSHTVNHRNRIGTQYFVVNLVVVIQITVHTKPLNH